MKKTFKTKVDDYEILDLIINYFSDDYLKSIINENPMIKFSCNPKGGKRFKFNREIAVEKLRSFSRKDRMTKKAILITWEKSKRDRIREIDLIPETEDLYEKLSRNRKTQEIFEACTILWQKGKLELNKCGDKLYGLYKDKVAEIKEHNEEVEENIDNKLEEIHMNKDIMSLSIGECIQALANAKREISELNYKIEEKQEEIDKLKASLESIIDNRDLKKEIKLLSRKVGEVDPLIKEENEKLKVHVDELKNENLELRKMLDTINKNLNNININTIIKAVSENQNNLNNTLKGGLIESIKKNMDSLMLGLEERLMAKLEEKPTNPTRNTDVKNDKVETENKDFSTLIDSMLL